MEETKWWAKAFLVSAVICLFLLLAAPFSYKYEFSPLMTAFSTMLVAVGGALIVFVAGIVMAIVCSKKALVRERNIIMMAVGLSLIPMFLVVPQMSKGRSVPAIHDISTDTVAPPSFVEIVKQRKETDNSLVYAFEGSKKKLVELQKAAYPDLATINSDLSVAASVEQAASVLREMGLEVVTQDKQLGLVEATATTFWFGFKDDVVVRVMADGAGSKIDLRSASRVGQSDIGVNAARILDFSAKF